MQTTAKSAELMKKRVSKAEKAAREYAQVMKRKIAAQFPGAKFKFGKVAGEDKCWRLEVKADAAAYRILDIVRPQVSRILQEEAFSVYVTVGSPHSGRVKRKRQTIRRTTRK